jgi:hypothetical protein
MDPIDQTPTETTETVMQNETIPDGSSTVPDDVTLVRDFILATDPALVPELVTGTDVGAVLASVTAARAAYRRIAERVGAGQPVAGAATRPTPAPVVPAGGAAPFVIDPGDLSSGELIRRGISAARRAGG